MTTLGQYPPMPVTGACCARRVGIITPRWGERLAASRTFNVAVGTQSAGTSSALPGTVR